MIPLGVSEAEARQIVGAYVASTEDRDGTLTAIARAIPCPASPVRAAVPFQFDRRWSSLTLGPPGPEGVYVLGAPEALTPHLRLSTGQAEDLAKEMRGPGCRTASVSYCSPEPPDSETLRGPDGVPRLPSDLQPIALVALAEDLRPDARAALAAFWGEGVTIKVLSGDNPETVLAIAREVGFPDDARAIGGPELGQLSEADFARAVRDRTVFGRVDPEQKARIVRTLRGQGHTVAMIGDGANDILAMKAGQLAIAMASGSPATRGAADVVLLRDSFATLTGRCSARVARSSTRCTF